MGRQIFRLLVVGILGGCACTSQAQAASGVDDRDTSFSRAQVPLIFPGMSTQGTAEARYQAPAGAERVELRAPSGERLEALFCPAAAEAGADLSRRPTVLYFYGNAQCLATALSQVELLRTCGANVLIADYLGYGQSEGKPSEAGCYATAMALYDYAMSRRDIDRSKLIAGGWSLGAAVAIDLASRKNMAGLVTFSAYTSKRDLARIQFPQISPMAIEHPFLSRDKICTISCPTLIVHGRGDTLVPFSMSAQLRTAAAGKPLTYLPIDGAGHNDLFQVGEKQIAEAMGRFLQQVNDQPHPTSQPK